MAKIARIGASRHVGSRILTELSERGQQIAAIARPPQQIACLPHVTPIKGGLFEKAKMVIFGET